MSSTVASQTRWDNHLGVFRSSPGDNHTHSRNAQTAALIHFSRAVGFVTSKHSRKFHFCNKLSAFRSVDYNNINTDNRFSRSGSVPNLARCTRSPTIVKQISISPTTQAMRQHYRALKKEYAARGNIQRNNLNKSIDESGVFFTNTKSSMDSQTSMGLDYFITFHELIGNAMIIMWFSGEFIGNKRERTKRSDTSKRHILARQKQIDSSEIHNASKVNFSENPRY